MKFFLIPIFLIIFCTTSFANKANSENKAESANKLNSESKTNSQNKTKQKSKINSESKRVAKAYSILKNQKSYYIKGEFLGARKATIRYVRFGKRKGKNGSLVFVTGLSENYLKYTELFYDLYKKGWSPIYTYDHRGQGFSERLSKEKRTIHVDSHKDYTEDLNSYITQVVLKDSFVDPKKLNVIAYSMGASVLITYLQSPKYKNYFRSAVFAAPLIKIRTPIPYFFYENLALTGFQALCFVRIELCSIEAWNPFKYITKTRRTTSLARHKFKIHIHSLYNFGKYSNPSYRWVLEMSNLYKEFLNPEKTKNIKIPILILKAELENVVSNIYQDKFCNLLPKQCHVATIPGLHEIFLEQDQYRDFAIKTTTDFFLKQYKLTTRNKKQ